MRKLLILIVAASLLGGCVVYPGYDYGYYGGYPYYYGPSVDFVFMSGHGGHGFHHGGGGGGGRGHR